MKRLLVLALIGVVVAAAIPLVIGGPDAFDQLSNVAPKWILLMLGLVFAGWNINALRLRLLLGHRARALNHRHALATVMATEGVFCATPGGTGAPFTMIKLLRHYHVRASESSAVFVIDQMTDLLFFVLALPIVITYGVNHFIQVAPDWLLILAFVSQFLLIAAAFLAFRYHRRSLRMGSGLLNRLGISRPRRRRWAKAQLRFHHAVRTTLKLSPRVLLATFLLCCAHWLLRYSILYLAVQSLGGQAQWSYTFFVQMLAMAAGHLTFLPGGAGGTELTSAALLAPYLSSGTAAAAILIWRSITYYFYLLAGGAVLVGIAGWRYGVRELLRNGN